MPDVLITNFETGITLEYELTAQLRRLDGRGLLVVDESFFVKNRDARRTRSLRRVRAGGGRALVLFGTPAPHAPAHPVPEFNPPPPPSPCSGAAHPPRQPAQPPA